MRHDRLESLRVNSLLLGFGFLMVIADIHTVGHAGGPIYRIVICLLGFLFIWIGLREVLRNK